MVHVAVSYGGSSALESVKKLAFRPRFTSFGTLAGAVLWVSGAAAHIELTEPIARYAIQPGTDIGMKGCPCGMATGGGNSNRTCNVAKDGSDANRDEARAFTAAAGSTVTLKFKETVGHAGKYRVAFDAEGADFDDFNANVLTQVDDPNGSMGNVQNGNNWEIEVTLPDTPCTHCTLQLIQVMDPSTLGGSVDGSKLASMSTYYTCVDLVLTGEEGSTAGAGSESVEVSTGDVGSFASTDVAVSSAEAATSADVVEPAPTSPVVTPAPTPTPSAQPTPPTPITPAPVPSETAPVTSATAPVATTTSGSTTGALPANAGSPTGSSGCAIAGEVAAVGAPGSSAVWALFGAVGIVWRRRRLASSGGVVWRRRRLGASHR